MVGIMLCSGVDRNSTADWLMIHFCKARFAFFSVKVVDNDDDTSQHHILSGISVTDKNGVTTER